LNKAKGVIFNACCISAPKRLRVGVNKNISFFINQNTFFENEMPVAIEHSSQISLKVWKVRLFE